jgi:phospholipid transport system transporter-binding protein
MNAKPVATPGPARVEALGNGRFKVHGALHAETVTELFERSPELFRDAPQIDIDLSGVPEGDSAGLALLIEWLRLANHNKQKIEFRNLPAQLAALARISAIEDLLTPNANGGAPR